MKTFFIFLFISLASIIMGIAAMLLAEYAICGIRGGFIIWGYSWRFWEGGFAPQCITGYFA